MRIVSRSGCCALLLGLSLAAALGAETAPLEAEQFEDVLRGIAAERSEADQLRRAKALAVERRFSSMQVKTLAARLRDDSARLEFCAGRVSPNRGPGELLRGVRRVHFLFQGDAVARRGPARNHPGASAGPGAGCHASENGWRGGDETHTPGVAKRVL